MKSKPELGREVQLRGKMNKNPVKHFLKWLIWEKPKSNVVELF